VPFGKQKKVPEFLPGLFLCSCVKSLFVKKNELFAVRVRPMLGPLLRFGKVRGKMSPQQAKRRRRFFIFMEKY